jgi:hypothetical protein
MSLVTATAAAPALALTVIVQCKQASPKKAMSLLLDPNGVPTSCWVEHVT